MDIQNLEAQLHVILRTISDLTVNMTKMGQYFIQITADQLATKERLTKLENNVVELTKTVGQLQQKESRRLSSQFERNPSTHTVSMLYID